MTPCAEPGCTTLVRHGSCSVHRRRAFAGRPPRQARGHGAPYDARRRQLLAGGPLCFWGCGRPATTADYAVAFAEGGTLDDLVPACADCNHRRGSALGGRRSAEARAS